MQADVLMNYAKSLYFHFYAPLAYVTHLTESCAFSKFACIEGGGIGSV